jgi:hypothetical protein
VINIWFTLLYTSKEKNKLGRHVVSVITDNTSALSWFHHASSPEIEAQFISRMINLLTITPAITPTGADSMPSQTGQGSDCNNG